MQRTFSTPDPVSLYVELRSGDLVVTAADLSADGNHLNVTGLGRYAELMWQTFFAG